MFCQEHVGDDHLSHAYTVGITKHSSLSSEATMGSMTPAHINCTLVLMCIFNDHEEHCPERYANIMTGLSVHEHLDTAISYA
jgi:hypothetical protein